MHIGKEKRYVYPFQNFNLLYYSKVLNKERHVDDKTYLFFISFSFVFNLAE